ncbi:MAG TPA: dockerin type I domain-containing protein, partial [Thermoguttaceae bacterium]|nr:dockerin type I domain-containing protein [Thermoguttaceae bacterium]
DVGAVALAGSASYDDGTFTVEGSGNNIYGTADEFYFVHQTLAGDGRITARVESLENTAAYAKAGVMMRESLDAGAKNVAALVTVGYGARMQYRAIPGATTYKQAEVAGPAAPYWVRLTRTGDTFVSEISADGAAWTELGRVTIVMAQTIYVGLPVTSYAPQLLCTAVFTDVTAGAYAAPPLPGDADGNGTVDAGDAAVLSAHWGQSGVGWDEGDFNDDGWVNALDASILAANWGATLAGSSESAGPSGAATTPVTIDPLAAGASDSPAAPLVGPIVSRDPELRRPLASPRPVASERAAPLKTAALLETALPVEVTEKALWNDLSSAVVSSRSLTATDLALAEHYGPQPPRRRLAPPLSAVDLLLAELG